MSMLSVIIPSRNSPFLTKTIEDVLQNAEEEIEVIVNVDEKHPDRFIDGDRVTYLLNNSPVGLRKGINNCVARAKGRFIMKTDDHCAFSKGFDRVLKENHLKDNWVQVPRRYALDPINWTIENRSDNKYPIDYMYTDFPRKGKANDDGTHGVEWRERRDQRGGAEHDIDETPSIQGSAYFMTKNYFDNFLHGLHEEGYGQFAQESQEICFKTWLGGGRVMVNKKTHYAHLHKGKIYGRMYKMPHGNVEADSWSADRWLNNKEPNMIYKFEWFIDEKFPNMPTWPKNWKEEIRRMGWVK